MPLPLYPITKRALDVAVAFSLLFLLAPLMLATAILIRATSRGGALFRQVRVGRGGTHFTMLKFRTMRPRLGAESGSFDAGDASRATWIGRILRLTKLDELPQLFNVLVGDMSLVGPRPEVPAWVRVYPQRWTTVLRVRPGISDPASIVYRNEEQILAQAEDPQSAYRSVVLPHKLELYERYVEKRCMLLDLKILWQTAMAVAFGGRRHAPPFVSEAQGNTMKDSPMSVPFAVVRCDGNELAYLREVLESGWLTTASKARRLEERFAAAVGARFACAVNSCTAALHLALEALGVGPRDKVLVPTMTFTATAEVVRYLGADPVLLDVDYPSSLLTPEIVRRGIERHPDAKALIVVHFGGQPARMLPDGPRQGILEICRQHGVRIVEDAAHAFPACIGGRMVGTFGDATCFSFYANKTITTGEGGMISTEDPEIARRVRVMRLHGIDRDVFSRYTSNKPQWEYDVVAPGFKYNMPDINAAIGLAQLERADQMRRQRQRCAERYFRDLAGLECVDLPRRPADPQSHAWHLFPIILREGAPVGRDRLIELLAEAGVGTSVHYKPLHRMTYYRRAYGLDPADFPNAERIWQGCLSLPIYPSLSSAEIDYVCSWLTRLLKAKGNAAEGRAA